MSYESDQARFLSIRGRIGTLLQRSNWLGLDLARQNLIYWLNGSGADWVNYPSGGAFQNSGTISNELNTTHIRRLKAGIINRLRSGPQVIFPQGGNSDTPVSFLGNSESIPRRANPLINTHFEEFYIETSVAYHNFLLNGEIDLANAFGGLTLRSRISIRLLEANLLQPERSRIRFENWFCKVYDLYDWDTGNEAAAGTEVPDNDMNWYSSNSSDFSENHRQRGKDYKIFSIEWAHPSAFRSGLVQELGRTLPVTDSLFPPSLPITT